MPDNSELDSPTTAVGEEEYFPTEKALLDQVYQLTEQLEHSENFIKTLQTELDYQSQEHSDYRFKSEYETSRLRHLLISLETDLASKKDELFDLKYQLDQIDGQLRGFQITFDKVCRQRDDAWQRLGEISYSFELEEARNKILYDTLKSVVLERDILAQKYAWAKGKINRREIKNSQLETEIKKWTQKYWRERKGFIKHDIQLAEEQKKIKKLRKSKKKLLQDYKELDSQYDKLEKQKDKFKNRLTEQVNNLKKLNLNKKTIQKELEWAKDEIDHLDFKLENRTKKLIRARSKIKDLENRQKELKTVAENKKVSPSLIKYTPPLFSNKKTEENLNLERDITNTYHCLIDTVADTQTHLGVSDLTQITTSYPLPEGKSLADLITFYQENKDKASTTPSQSQVILGEPSETLIINQIITECDLGLNENSSLTQVIDRIKKLIKAKPPIIKPVNQLNDTPFGESLEKIIEIDLNSLEQELGIELSGEIKEQIEKATNYQELSSIRNQEIKSYLEKGQNTEITTQPKEIIKPIARERIIWISLLVISLMVIGGLVVRLRKKGKRV